jgi:hypothetical protein
MINGERARICLGEIGAVFKVGRGFAQQERGSTARMAAEPDVSLWQKSLTDIC